MKRNYDIFISYSGHDAHFVKPIVQLLGLNNHRVFWDNQSISPGERWRESLEKAILSSKTIVLLWCCHSSMSEWVAHEISLGLKEQKKLAPILLCLNPVPNPVSDYQWIDLSSLVSHECINHPSRKSAPNKLLDFRSIVRREMGSNILEPYAVDKAWRKVTRQSLSLWDWISYYRIPIGAALVALSAARPFPSPFRGFLTVLINLIVALIGILVLLRRTTLSDSLRELEEGKDESTEYMFTPIIKPIDDEAKLVALTVFSIVAQLERGTLDTRGRA